MVWPRKEDLGNDGEAEGLDRQDRSVDDDIAEETREIRQSGSSGPLDAARRGGGVSRGLAERLRDVLRYDGGGDLVMDQNDAENGILQWLQAVDLQVIGACRADERLKPLLKLNVSSGVAEDRLIVQLSQHFEVSEVGMLARCLCVPLVSIRVGKVNKLGNLLCPTTIRGHLNLTLLTSSDMRILFAGDDGCNESLAVVSKNSDSSGVVVEEISADSSGRSFLLKVPGNQVSYFWCSERSKLLGTELLGKMRDLLQRKPSLSQLTGICESRLDSFATHLRAYLLGSTNSVDANLTASSTFLSTASSPHESDANSPSSSMISSSSCFRLTTGQPGSKDGLPRRSSSLKGGPTEKSRKHGDSHSRLLTMNNPPITSISCVTHAGSTSQNDDDKIQEKRWHQIAPSCLPEMPCRSSPSPPLSFQFPQSQVPAPSSSIFPPYYCWCPPCTSSLQYTVTTPHLPSMPSESVPLPPLSTFLSDVRSSVSFLPSKPLDLAEIPTLDFPALLPEPLVRFPVSSFAMMPSTQQIPTFTPFMCDPIVHIPVIDVCSSGQGYLVSAGPAISSAIPPLLPNLVKPLMPEAESAVEKNGRETLRMLLASTPTSPQLMNVLPAVLTSIDEHFSHVHGKKHGVAVAGSHGLYCGVQDAAAVTNGICLMGLASSSVGRDGCERNKLNDQNQDDLQEQSKRLEISEEDLTDVDDFAMT